MYKRQTVQFGAQYRLSSGNLTAVNYVGDGEVVVFSFVHSTHGGERHRAVRLAGLDPDAAYTDGERRYSGALLLSRGLFLPFAGDYASNLTVLRVV